MARMKAVTNVQSRLFQFWVFASLIYGAASLVLGVSLLGGGALISMLPLEALDAFDALRVAWTLIYLWFLFQALAFARNNGDSQIRRPLVWLLLAFVPIGSAIVAWAVFPRIMPPWIKQMSRVSVSSSQVLVFTLLSAIANALPLVTLEMITLSFLLSGIAMVSLAWVLRDVLLGRRAN